MAIYSNLTIDQGSTFSAFVDVTDADGDALDLTGFSVAGQIRKTYSSSTAIDFTAAVSSAINGSIQITLSDTQTNNLKAGRYVYDIEIISEAGEVTRVLEGQVEVTPGVTRTS